MMQRSNLKLVFMISLFLLAGVSAYAQSIMVDYMGRPIQSKQYVDVQGSPYLNDEWTSGLVQFSDGKLYDKVDLKYDQVEDQLMFLNKEGQAQLFADSIQEFIIDGRVFRKGYKSVDSAKPSAFYEVLEDGKTQLLKRTTKKVFEEKPYSSATTVKTIQTNEFYYILKKDSTFVKIKKDKKSVVGALADKKSELETYIKSNALNLREDSDMAKLVAYYNSL